MGPHGLVASYLHRDPPPHAGQADRASWPGRGRPPGKTGCASRRGHERLRAAGAGPDHDLPFTDRVIVTLVYLRFQLPHAALAVLYGVDRSTITRAVGEIRPLLAARGFAVPGEPGVRLRTLADVFAYAAARGVEPAARRHGSAGQAPARGQARPPRVRVGQEEAEHEEGHRHHRREGPHPVGRGVPPRADARPDRGADRGHRRPVHAGTPRSRPRSTPGTGAWPRSSPTRSRPRR